MSVKKLWRPELQAVLPGTVVDSEDITDKAAAIAGAYDELGLWNAEQREAAPETIRASLGELVAASQGLQLELYIPIPLNHSFGLADLIEAYDDRSEDRSFIASRFWDSYRPEDPGAPLRTGARGMLLGGEDDKSGEPGLYLTSQSFFKQRRNANHISSRLSKRNNLLDVNVLDPAGWVALNAIRRFEGKSLMDSNFTNTVFVGLEPQFVAGNLATDDHYMKPVADTSDGQIMFNTHNDSGSAVEGVRFSLGL